MSDVRRTSDERRQSLSTTTWTTRDGTARDGKERTKRENMLQRFCTGELNNKLQLERAGRLLGHDARSIT
jgi:hypothetical protein